MKGKLKKIRKNLTYYSGFHFVYAFVFLFFIYDSPWNVFHAYIWFGVTIHCIASFFLLNFIWIKHPFKKRERINHTIGILTLGIIGMWIWYHNQLENGLAEKED